MFVIYFFFLFGVVDDRNYVIDNIYVYVMVMCIYLCVF